MAVGAEFSIGAVVVNYNQRLLTEACVAALLRSDYPRLAVVLVDNGSTDGSGDYLRGRFPSLQVLETRRNLGFAGGSNVGLKYLLEGHVDLIFLLNNDTEVAPDCASHLASAALEHPDMAVFAPKIVYYDRPQVLWYAGGNIRLHRPQGASHFGFGNPDAGQFDVQRRVTFVSGCAMAVRRCALERIGLFDEGFFAYCEDLDWCVRAGRLGYRALYVPTARVCHRVSMTVLANPKGERLGAYLLARNRFMVQRRYGSLASAVALVPLYLASKPAQRAFAALVRGRPQGSVALLRGIADGLRQRLGDPPADWL